MSVAEAHATYLVLLSLVLDYRYSNAAQAAHPHVYTCTFTFSKN